MMQQLKRVVTDENGGEMLESALILGLIVIGALVIIGGLGTKVLAKWTSLSSMMD